MNFMNPHLSSNLDILRFGAALVVYLSHAMPIFFPRLPLPIPGHHAVVLFFVLSGFVIAHVASKPELTVADYVVDRISRLLSVALPGLLLSLAVTVAAGEILAKLPASQLLGQVSMNTQAALWKTFLNLVFLAQSVDTPVLAPLNGVFWSLNYEFWYYVIFATWNFGVTGWRRAVFTAIAVSLAGIKIVLLLPCWIVGFLVYRLVKMRFLEVHRARWLLLFSIIVYALLFWFDISAKIRDSMDIAFPNPMSTLGASRGFFGDYLLAATFGVALFSLAFINQPNSKVSLRQLVWSRKLGGMTFSLYAVHIPLLALALVCLPAEAYQGILGSLSALAVLPLLVVPFAIFTEHKRRVLRRFLIASVLVARSR